MRQHPRAGGRQPDHPPVGPLRRPAPAHGRPAAPRAEASTDPDALYEEGRKDFSQGFFKAAIEKFEAAYKRSKDPLILYNIGQSYKKLHDEDPQLEYLRKARTALQSYVAAVEKDPSLGADPEEVKPLLAEIDAELARREPKAQPEGPSEPSEPTVPRGEDPGKKLRLTGVGLMGGGGALLVVGSIVGGVVTMMASAQSRKTNIYDFIKMLLYDSTGYENVGDWAVGDTKKFPVTWKNDRIEMSDDTSINFYRIGTADIMVNNRSLMRTGQPVKWNIMLKGARSGYSSFSILSSPSNEIQPKLSIDSLFGNKPFTARLLKSCDTKPLMGYYYYEVKIPKKDIAYIKISWLTANGNTALRIDGYDSWSNYAAKLECR